MIQDQKLTGNYGNPRTGELGQRGEMSKTTLGVRDLTKRPTVFRECEGA